MEDEDLLMLAEAASSSVALMVTELIVALEAKGLLTRDDIAKAMVRAQVTAEIRDAVRTPKTWALTGWIEDAIGTVEGRIAAKPEFHALRRAREAWLRSGQVGPDPALPDGYKAPRAAL